MKRSRKPRASAASSCPFLVVDENRLAWTEAQSLLGVDKWMTDRGRLIFIYGPSGTGKSHLCELVAGQLAQSDPGSVLRYDSVELLERLGPDHRHEDFWPESAAVGRVLIVEDLQHLRHESVQRAFAWRIDEMLRRGTTGLFTCISQPGELKGVLPRLRSRLRGGTIIPIRMPGPASRLKLLEHFCSHLQIALPHDVLKLFSRELAASPRELLGTLLRFEELARARRELAALPLARAFLRHEPGDVELTLNDIAKATARQFGVRLSDMKSKARDQSIALPRQCAMFLCRELTGEHLAKIGGYFSNRSHSTVLHSCGRIAGLLLEDVALRHELDAIRRSLRGR
jgi:chromosomal replication initiator protein